MHVVTVGGRWSCPLRSRYEVYDILKGRVCQSKKRAVEIQGAREPLKCITYPPVVVFVFMQQGLDRHRPLAFLGDLLQLPQVHSSFSIRSHLTNHEQVLPQESNKKKNKREKRGENNDLLIYVTCCTPLFQMLHAKQLSSCTRCCTP